MTAVYAVGTALGGMATLIWMLIPSMSPKVIILDTYKDVKDLIGKLNRCAYAVDSDPTPKNVAALTQLLHKASDQLEKSKLLQTGPRLTFMRPNVQNAKLSAGMVRLERILASARTASASVRPPTGASMSDTIDLSSEIMELRNAIQTVDVSAKRSVDALQKEVHALQNQPEQEHDSVRDELEALQAEQDAIRHEFAPALEALKELVQAHENDTRREDINALITSVTQLENSASDVTTLGTKLSDLEALMTKYASENGDGKQEYRTLADDLKQQMQVLAEANEQGSVKPEELTKAIDGIQQTAIEVRAALDDQLKDMLHTERDVTDQSRRAAMDALADDINTTVNERITELATSLAPNVDASEISPLRIKVAELEKLVSDHGSHSGKDRTDYDTLAHELNRRMDVVTKSIEASEQEGVKKVELAEAMSDVQQATLDVRTALASQITTLFEKQNTSEAARVSSEAEIKSELAALVTKLEDYKTSKENSHSHSNDKTLKSASDASILEIRNELTELTTRVASSTDPSKIDDVIARLSAIESDMPKNKEGIAGLVLESQNTRGDVLTLNAQIQQHESDLTRMAEDLKTKQEYAEMTMASRITALQTSLEEYRVSNDKAVDDKADKGASQLSFTELQNELIKLSERVAACTSTDEMNSIMTRLIAMESEMPQTKASIASLTDETQGSRDEIAALNEKLQKLNADNLTGTGRRQVQDLDDDLSLPLPPTEPEHKPVDPEAIDPADRMLAASLDADTNSKFQSRKAGVMLLQIREVMGTDMTYDKALDTYASLMKERNIRIGRTPDIFTPDMLAQVRTLLSLDKGMKFDAEREWLPAHTDILELAKLSEKYPTVQKSTSIDQMVLMLRQVHCLGGATASERSDAMSTMLGVTSLSSEQYLWLFPNNDPKRLCSGGLLNSDDLQYLSTTLSKIPNASSWINLGLAARDPPFMQLVATHLLGPVNKFVQNLMAKESLEFVTTHIDDARTMSDFVDKHPAIVDSVSYGKVLNSLMSHDHDRSKKSDKGDLVQVAPLSVSAGFDEYWTAYTKVLNYRDMLFPVRIIVNARTVFPGDDQKERLAKETFDNMVGAKGAGKFGTIKQGGTSYGPFFLTVQNGSNLETVIDNDMDVIKTAIVGGGSGYKHYVYSAYGFSGSGKTRTLIHNPDTSEKRDKPVLELITTALKGLSGCTVDMYLNDLYGEIMDDGCVQGGSESEVVGQRYEKMTCYSSTDLTRGIQSSTKHVQVDKTVMDTHRIPLNLHERTQEGGVHIDDIPKLLNTFAESGVFESKVKHDFGNDAVQRFHIRMTPNNANSSRAHTFIRLVIRKAGTIVGKVTLIDMAGSEDVDVIQQNYFNKESVPDSTLGNLAKLSSSAFNNPQKGPNKKSLVQDWARAYMESNTKPSFLDIHEMLRALSLVPQHEVTNKTHLKLVDLADLLGTTLQNMFQYLFSLSDNEMITSTINLENWKNLGDKFETLKLHAAKSSVDDIINTPFSVLNALACVNSLEQLKSAWNLIIRPDVDVNTWDMTTATANLRSKYRLVKSEDWPKIQSIVAKDLENDTKWLNTEPLSLFNMYTSDRCGLYNLARDVPKNNKDPKSGEKKAHTVRINLMMKLASTAQDIQRQIKRLAPKTDVAKEAMRADVAHYRAVGREFEKIDDVKALLSGKTDNLRELVDEWYEQTSVKDNAIRQVHCPVRYQGNYIAQTLQNELSTHLQHVQDPNNPSSRASWIDCFLKATDSQEDVKYVQFINIRTDFKHNAEDQAPKEASYKLGAIDSLNLAVKLNP